MIAVHPGMPDAINLSACRYRENAINAPPKSNTEHNRKGSDAGHLLEKGRQLKCVSHMVYVSVDRYVILNASDISISRITIKHMLFGLKTTTIEFPATNERLT